MLPIAVQDIISPATDLLQPIFYRDPISLLIQISRENLGRPIRSYRCICTFTPTHWLHLCLLLTR